MAILFCTEFASFLRVETASSMFVDLPSEAEMRNREPLRISLHLSLPEYPCAALSVDVQDVLGTHVMDVGGELHKLRLRPSASFSSSSSSSSSTSPSSKHVPNSKPIKSGDKLSHAEALQQKNEGCEVHGHIFVKKVPGNFHLSAHAHPELLQVLFDHDHKINVSHTIHHLSFGPPLDANIRASIADLHANSYSHTLSPSSSSSSSSSSFASSSSSSTPSSSSSSSSSSKLSANSALSPLDGLMQIALPNSKGSTSYEYYIKIVPTIFESLTGDQQFTYQFTAHANEIAGHFQLPAIFFRYDMSPITVKFTQRRQSLTHFLVQICAIIGGVFTVLGLVNAFIHTSVTHLRKRSLGKLG